MSISVGDKFIVEIGSIAELPDGKKKYFIKPFESLVFDRKGLSQLEKFDVQALKEYDEGYNKGYEDGAKNQDEVQYKAGYNLGFARGVEQSAKKLEVKAENYDITDDAYNKALEDASKLIYYVNDAFIQKYYPEDYNYGLRFPQLSMKYGLTDIIKKWNEYNKEEFKVGDLIKGKRNTQSVRGIVFNSNDICVQGITEYRVPFSWIKGECESMNINISTIEEMTKVLLEDKNEI